MFTAEDAGSRQVALDDNRRAIDDAVTIGALLEHSRNVGLPLALEPLHPMYAADRACINTLAQALDLCDTLGEGLGVIADVCHVWWDPELEAQIARAGKERILGYHVSDWLVPTTDLLLDRGMMGDGVIDLPHIRSHVESAVYEGFTEVEIMSERDWWRRDPDEVMATCLERMATLV
jgi:sugar phosphate isomerase/epimerase